MVISDEVSQLIHRCSKDEASYQELLALFNSLTNTTRADTSLNTQSDFSNEERYRQMFDKNKAIKLLMKPETGQIVDANIAAAEFYGYTQQQLKSMNIMDINILSEEEITNQIRDAATHHLNFFEFRHRLASGEIRDVEVYSNIIDMPEGQLRYSIILDATEKRDAELLYRALFEQSNDGVFILDFEGTHLQANQRACDMLGYSLEELIGSSFRDIVVTDEHDQSQNILEKLFAGEHVQPYERAFRHKDGSIIQMEVNVEAVYNKAGELKHIQSILRDITERKQIEIVNHAFLQDMKALQEIHLELSAVNTLDDLYYKIVESAHQRLGIERIALFVINEESKQLLSTYGTDPEGNIRNEYYYHEDIGADHWTHEIYNAPNHAIMRTDDFIRDNNEIIGKGWKAASALWNGSRAIGYIVCDNFVTGKSARPYERELISILGSTFGHLIERKQMEGANRAFLDDMKALQQIQLELSAIESLDDLYYQMIALAHQRLGMKRIALFLLDEKGEHLLGTYGTDKDGNIRDETYYRAWIHQDNWTHEIVNAPNHSKIWLDQPIYDNSEVIGYGWKAAATLWNGQRAIGYIACDNFITRRPPRSYETELISILGNTFGHLIERKQMESANRAFLNDMKAMQEIQLELSAVESLNVLYYRMIELARERLSMDRVGLFLLDETGTYLLGIYGTDKDGNIHDASDNRQQINPDHWTYEIVNAPNHTKLWVDKELRDNDTIVGHGWNAVTALWNGQRAIGYIACDNLLSGRPIRPYEAELISILGSTFGHLIERRQMEEALRANEEHYRSVVTALSEGILLYGRNGYVESCNPAAEEILGYSEEELIGLSAKDQRWDVMREDGSPFPHEELPAHKTFLTGKPIKNVVIGIRKSGDDPIWLSVNSQPMFHNDDPQPYAVLISFTDITERKLAQDRQFELALEKERRGLLSTFIQNAAHEFRTPLSTINSATYIMTRVENPVSLQNKTKQVQYEVQRISKLVDMLLMMVKLEGESNEAHSTVNISMLLSGLCQHMGTLYDDGPDLKVDIPTQTTHIIGEQNFLKEAIQQLMDNAFRFTPQEGTITVCLEELNDSLCIHIKNTGVGIEEDHLPHIFETFWRDDTAHSTPGFGLGLAIAKKIIELHTGTITVKSTADQGTTFTVTLPLETMKQNDINSLGHSSVTGTIT